MKIILFCLPLFGRGVIKQLVQNKIPPGFIVPPEEGHPLRETTIQLAHEYNIPVIRFDRTPADKVFVTRIKQLNPDLIIVSTFNHLIPESVYSSAKIGAINAHPSLLPEYRGNNPFYHVIKNGEGETGITLHKLSESFDAGAILKQKKVTIYSRETTGTLQKKLIPIMADEIANLVQYIMQKGFPKSKPQPKIAKNIASKVTLPLKEVDWNHSSINIDRYIRAANPYYTIYAKINGTNISILSGKVGNTVSPSKSVGEIEDISERGMLVHTGNGAYLITSVDYDNIWRGDPAGLMDLELIKIGDCFEVNLE